jgi:glyoxylase-like metal-dependent hydrolase (beta-lactamase superfamily II)
MQSKESRREFLRAALGTAAAAGFVGNAWLDRATAQTADDSMSALSLRGGLMQIVGAGSNVLLLPFGSGAAMVDSGAPESAASLVTFVRALLGGVPISLLFNTHWHLNHTGANEVLGQNRAKIIAHENTRLWMSTEYYVDWQDRTYSPRPATALPTATFYSSDPQPIAVEMGDERIEYGHLREAHTDGDIYVFFRERNVLAAGGATSAGAYPVLDYATGGWIGGLVDATKKLLELADEDTLIVPGRGPARRRPHLEQQLEMLMMVRQRVENLMRKGRSAAEMLAAGVTDEFDSAWGDNRERFIENIYNGLWWQGRLNGSL